MRARWRPEGVALAVVLAGLAALLTLQSAGARQVGPFIAAADHFVDSVGVNVHLHYDGTPYRDQFDLIKSRLLELGVRHVRDGLIDTDVAGLLRPPQRARRRRHQGDLHHRLRPEPGAAVRLPVAGGAFVRGLRSAQRGRQVRRPAVGVEAAAGDLPPRRPARHLVGGALTRFSARRSRRQAPIAMVGDLSGFFDQANIHNYLAGRHPGTPGWGDDGYGSIDWNLRLIRRYSGGKPITTTEIGYQDAPGIVDSVPQEVVGRYLPRLLVEQYPDGHPPHVPLRAVRLPELGQLRPAARRRRPQAGVQRRQVAVEPARRPRPPDRHRVR